MIQSRMIANLPIDVQRKFEYATSPVRAISGISIVIPIRGIDRKNNLKYCISKLLQQSIQPIEIIISEEDSHEHVDIKDFYQDSRVRKIFTKSKPGGLFNKCKAVNAGVIAATHKMVSMNDADIVLPRDYLYKVSLALQEHEICFIAKEIYNMDLLKTGIIWRGGKRVDYFSGGSISFTKDAYIKIGGMNERFEGYGSEDCEFWGRATSLCKVYENREFPLLHLNHKRLHNYSQNGDLYNSLVSQDINQRLEALKSDLNKHITGSL